MVGGGSGRLDVRQRKITALVQQRLPRGLGLVRLGHLDVQRVGRIELQLR